MEEIDQEGLLKTLQGFPVGERVILGHFATVQVLLALIFDSPVTVSLVKQLTERSSPGHGVIVRFVHLVTGDRIICTATSRIPLLSNHPTILTEVSAGILGLGQIAYKHNLPTKRRLVSVSRDNDTFSRSYVIEGEGILMTISEVFHRPVFEEVGWC